MPTKTNGHTTKRPAKSRRPRPLTAEERAQAKERARGPDGRVDPFQYLIETAQPLGRGWPYNTK